MAETTVKRVVLQTDMANIVGTPASGSIECEVTLAADNTLRFFLKPGETYAPRLVYVAGGSHATSGQTSVPLYTHSADDEMAVGRAGVPVSRSMTTDTVAASWTSTNTPAGNWTATLWRRTDSGTFSPVATFTVATT